MTRPDLYQCQDAFAAYLLDAERGPGTRLAQWMAGQSTSATLDRLRVYRNNVLHSLTGAMQAQFPVTSRVVGETFFRALARDYVTANPPNDPALTFIGEDFPHFIQASEHCSPLPWLSDLARLEWLCRKALHAADDSCLQVADVAQMDPEKLPDMVPVLHDSVTLFCSSWPVLPIWEAHQEDAADALNLDQHAQTRAVIVRPAATVQVLAVTPPVFHFLTELSKGKSLLAAWLVSHPDTAIDGLPSLLVWLLQQGLITQLH